MGRDGRRVDWNGVCRSRFRYWDVSFKLQPPGKTIVECELRAGNIVKLAVTPDSRKKDVMIEDPLAAPVKGISETKSDTKE